MADKKKKKDDGLTDYQRAVKRHNETTFDTLSPSNVQRLDPAFNSTSAKANYDWESEYLPSLPKSYGRKYNDKFDSFAKRMGIPPTEGQEFRRWLDAKEKMKINDAYYSTQITKKNTANKEKKIQQEKNKSIVTASEKPLSLIPLKQKPKSEKSVQLPGIKVKKKTSLLDDLKSIGKLGVETLNPFDDVDAGQALENYANRGMSKSYKEIQRGSNRAVDSASFGVMSNLDKKLSGKTPDYLSQREFGEGGGTDLITTGLGYLVPGAGGYKLLNSSKVGKALTEFGSKSIPKRLASEAAKGSIIGASISGAEVAAREGLNPDDYNWKDNTKYIGLNTALGAIADPLLYGAGKGIAKGFESASNRTMRNLLPSTQQVEGALRDSAKSFKGSQALPKTGGIQNPGLVQDLIPKGSEVTNPSFLPPLKPKTNIDPLIPSVGKSINDLPPLNETSLLDRSLMFDGEKRTMPDFSYGKQMSEPNKPVNVYGAEIPYDKVQHAPSSYWRGRYEEFANYVNKNYDTNNLNKEALDDLWSQFAKYDEPVTLDDVVDLAYKDANKPVIDAAGVWNKTGNRPPVSQNAKKILLGEVKPKQKTIPPKQDLLPNLKPNNPVQQPLPPLQPLKNSMVVEQPVKPLGQHANNVEAPVKPLQSVPKQPNESSFYSTVRNPEKLSPELEQRLNDFDKTYKPMSNEELVNYANKYVTKDMEKAYQFVKNARKFDPRHVTVGHRLIDELQKAGQYDRALDVVERLAEQGTKAGQSIQSYSIYNRLSAEGQLLRAQRRVNKINESITNPEKQIKLTEQNIQDITHTADSIQRFTGQQEQANNVIKIMENIKKGNVATDAELDTVRSFVADAKKFVADLEPGAPPKQPKPIKDVRNRDKVVDFMDKREQLARKRLREIMGRANSMPVDALYALADIGASKIAKGTVKVADFTEDLVKEFGEKVRPYAQQIYNKAVETFNLQSESMTRQRLSEVEKITNKALKDKNISVDEAESIREFARQVGQMSGDAKLEHSMELQSVLQAIETPTFGQKLSTTQTIAQLLNPKTIIRNAVGNEMFYRVEQMNKLLATPVDILRSKITGGERTITFRTHNQGQYWQNWLTGAKAGWKGVNPMGLTTAYDLGPQAFRSKFNPLTYLEKSLGATLRSFDHAGYMRAYNKTLGELSSLRAINEGLTGQAKKEAIARYIREADDNMIQMADQYGKYATFQDNSTIATVLQKAKRGLNFKQDFGLGDLIIKYPKTPGNLIMRALEYSPAGIARSLYLLKSIGKAKNPLITKEATLAFTRAIMGTGGFSLLGYTLADKGILTSAGNSDYEVASLERNAGKQPNSVNVSALGRFINSGFNLDHAGTKEGDTFVSYDWAQPISMAIALGTGTNQSVKDNGKVNVYDAIKNAGDSVYNTTINMSVLKGVKDFLTSYPNQGISDKLGGVIEGAVGSFVPTLSNQIRQASDNTARSTYSPSLLPTIKNKAINRIPGLQNSLPPSYDTLGNKRENFQGGSNNLLNVFLNPSFISKYKPSAEAQFVLDMINKTGDKSLAPRIAQKKLDGKPLTSAQYSEMQRIMGEEVQAGLANLGGGTGDQETDAKAIEKILRDAGKTAREAIRSQRGE
ncbi:hypothetical protein V7150_19350 [Neobacillus drentensis]|uniref:hypothetical protein n=1 Tax=Neobacillus drentensis TaxID=220684 RepID=UPI0030005C1A